MAPENKSDKDQSKGYKLYETPSIDFHVISFTTEEKETIDRPTASIIVNGVYMDVHVIGNAYVLNDKGDTVDCWAPNSGGVVKHLLTEGVDPATMPK